MIIKIVASQGTTKEHVKKQLDGLLNRRDDFCLREDHPSIFLLEGPINEEAIAQIRQTDGFTSVSIIEG